MHVHKRKKMYELYEIQKDFAEWEKGAYLHTKNNNKRNGLKELIS